MTEDDEKAGQMGGPYRASRVVEKRMPPKPLVVRHEGSNLIIEAYPGWLPWKVLLRVVFTIGITAGALYADGPLRVILGLSAASLAVTTGLLLRKAVALTTLTLGPSNVRLVRRGPLLRQSIEVPLGGFATQGVSDLYRDEGDQVPIFYLDCSFGNQREKLFVALPADALEWIQDEIKIWRDSGPA